MHVDGFRFDLAPVLARELYEVNRLGTFFDIIQQDPVLSQVKLIAEPWDLGEGGYQVGNFPVGWAEWNGKYRDCVRSFWRGDRGQVADLASRLSGSSDLYAASGRRTYASVNFITAHDGFTLEDLVSYERKHNEANLEDNRDGSDHNLSRNWGVEGPTANVDIKALRRRVKHSLLATLLLSQGVPMLLGGDEMGRTQRGNNNAYCHDNELSWMDWDLSPEHVEDLQFTRTLVKAFHSSPVLRRRSFFTGRSMFEDGTKDLTWLRPDGEEMTDPDWM
jgi:glycogen operon protein